MKLSVVIVNYNVIHFLEQCLVSVLHAGSGLDMEVIVADNNSVDGSVKMVKEKFPQVRLIENHENLGFSKANNQAIAQASGEYILLLNPDTVVEEDTFRKVTQFMDQHPEAGGLGVKMVDGKGAFLPESKRGLPTPTVAFYKMAGLSRLFPGSRTFGRYHLGFLDMDKIHEVDILSGAFMLLRKTALDKTGLLDEDFFMYGEDIDLSYRLTLAGYKNFYFPETRIIHYKGESTRKSSVNYVLVFYNAMIIFARKHFSKKNARMFSFLIKMAIYLRAFVAILARFIKAVFLPVTDVAMIFTGIWAITSYWESQVLFPRGGHYPIEFITVAVPVYILVWLFAVYLSGGYDKPVRLLKIFQGLFIGTILILTVYGLLDETMRFSRALIILGASWALISMTGFRVLMHLAGVKSCRITSGKNRRFVIVGDSEEAGRVATLVRDTHHAPGFIGLVSPDEENTGNGFTGNLGQLRDIIDIYRIDEVIFCSKNLTPQLIIDKMTGFQNLQVDFKIAPPESLSIIGSNSITTGGDIYVLSINSISKTNNKRDKWLFDHIVALFLLVFLPLALPLMKKPLGLIMNIFAVFTGARSWVGYHPQGVTSSMKLPRIKKGVLNPSDAIRRQDLPKEIASGLNILYAKDYKITNDLNILLKAIRELGRR